MITVPTLTRTEASDVANAIFEGADALMLSAESAAGKYPEEAVATMDNIAREVEGNDQYKLGLDATRAVAGSTVSDAIAEAARQVAETVQVKAICTFTESGSTALRVARERPHIPIIALIPRIGIARRLSLVWGLCCQLTVDAPDLSEAVEIARNVVKKSNIAPYLDKIMITAGVPFNVTRTTNALRVVHVNSESE